MNVFSFGIEFYQMVMGKGGGGCGGGGGGKWVSIYSIFQPLLTGANESIIS